MPSINSISARTLAVPFRESFAHAAATRTRMQSLWVEIEDRNGLTGYGEGCPREYVTGETLTSSQEFVETQRGNIVAAIHDLDSLKAFVVNQRALIDSNPAAWCAVELALLDVFAKQAGVTVETLLDLPALTGSYRYSAVIGDLVPQHFEALLTRYRQAGFRDFKVKLSGKPDRDASKVATLRVDGIEPAQVRADANNLWNDAYDAAEALVDLDYPFFALEEPVATGDLEGMANLGRRFRCAMILDESATRSEQISALPEGVRWIVNLRVSKMGGLLRSLNLAKQAHDSGIGIIVGSHVGESSLLTRAALTVINAYRDDIVAYEGAFGTHLLEHDPVEPSLMFGQAGLLDVAAIPQGPGFGLRPAAA